MTDGLGPARGLMVGLMASAVVWAALLALALSWRP